MSAKHPTIGLRIGSRVRVGWGAFPREGTVLARSGDKWKVHFPAQNLIRLCGEKELEVMPMEVREA